MEMSSVLERQTEEPPGVGEEPPSPWEGVSLSQWSDWRWQMTHRLRSVEDFARIIDLTPERPKDYRPQAFPCGRDAVLCQPDPRSHDPNCPIRRQVIPTSAELVPFRRDGGLAR